MFTESNCILKSDPNFKTKESFCQTCKLKLCSNTNFMFNSCLQCCGYNFTDNGEIYTAADLFQIDNVTATVNYGVMNFWDVSSVTDMNNLLFGSMNEPMECWNVSSVTNMHGLFLDATNFNQHISTWTVSKVTDMNRMFRSAHSFIQPIGTWNVSRVTKMDSMFGNDTTFSQPIGT